MQRGRQVKAAKGDFTPALAKQEVVSTSGLQQWRGIVVLESARVQSTSRWGGEVSVERQKTGREVGTNAPALLSLLPSDLPPPIGSACQKVSQ